MVMERAHKRSSSQNAVDVNASKVNHLHNVNTARGWDEVALYRVDHRFWCLSSGRWWGDLVIPWNGERRDLLRSEEFTSLEPATILNIYKFVQTLMSSQT